MADAQEAEAAELLIHYFNQAGVDTSRTDCQGEIRRCVALIVEAAVEETCNSAAMRQVVRKHETN